MNPIDQIPRAPETQDIPATMGRPESYQPKRARWPGLLGAAVLFVAVVAAAGWMQHKQPAGTADNAAETGAVTPAPQAAQPEASKDPAMADSNGAAPTAPAKQ